MTEAEVKVWKDAIDSVLELLRIHPPSRIGEAAFMRKLINLKGQYNASTSSKPKKSG